MLLRKNPNRQGNKYEQFFWSICTIGVLALSAQSTFAQYNVSVQVQSESVQAGSSGVADIIFSNVINGVPALSGFQMQLAVTSLTGGLSLGTPIVPDSTPPAAVTPDLPDAGFGVISSSSSGFQAYNVLAAGTDPIVAGDGLVRVPFTTTSAAIGACTFTLDPTNTILSDGSGNPITFTPINGVITVTSVPEPTVCMIFAGSGVLLSERRKHLLS